MRLQKQVWECMLRPRRQWIGTQAVWTGPVGFVDIALIRVFGSDVARALRTGAVSTTNKKTRCAMYFMAHL